MTSQESLQALMDRDAVIVDVRSRREFESGHAPGSLNIPLRDLPSRLSELEPSRPILLCCASGARSASALHFLKTSGFQDVHDAGPWIRLYGMAKVA